MTEEAFSYRLADSTELAYDAVRKRVYGETKPDFVPRDIYSNSRATLVMLKAMLVHYWRNAGEEERGYLLSRKISIKRAKSEQRLRVVPGEAGAKAFEIAARDYENRRAGLVVLFMLGLGFRTKEAMLMKREALQAALRAGYVTLRRETTKGSKPRALPIGKMRGVIEQLLTMTPLTPHVVSAREDLSDKWKLLGELLASAAAQKITQHHMLARHVKVLALASGLATEDTLEGWSPHMLRHIFSTRMMRDGAPDAYVSFALGHSMETKTTNRYQHPTVEDLLPYMREIKP